MVIKPKGMNKTLIYIGNGLNILRKFTKVTNNYTSEEDAILTKMWEEGESLKDISTVLVRTVKSLTNRRRILGLPGRSPVSRFNDALWKSEEDEFLIENILIMTRDEMAYHLDKTKQAVSGRINRLRSQGLIAVKRTQKKQPKKPTKIEIPSEEGSVLLINLKRNQCHYPCNGQMYCGLPNNKSYGYCEAHHIRVWQHLS